MRLILLLQSTCILLFQVKYVASRRWMDPCGGTKRVESIGQDIWNEDAGNTGGTGATAINLKTTFHTLSEKASGLKRKVRELKNLYATHRFRDTEIVEDMERIGLRLEGMPSVPESTASAIANINALRSVQSAFEHLAKVSVFLDQARIGESLAQNEHMTFETSLRHLEDHSEYGLYWILCELQRVIVLSGKEVDPDAVRRVLAIKVAEVDNNSMRHTRDYLVLRDTERVLDQISVNFAALHLVSA